MSKRTGNWWLIVSGLLFGFYCLNVAIGKLALLFDKEPLITIGDVGEFAILFSAVICLVITMLIKESHREGQI
jgi:hypothetical protein